MPLVFSLLLLIGLFSLIRGLFVCFFFSETFGQSFSENANPPQTFSSLEGVVLVSPGSGEI